LEFSRKDGASDQNNSLEDAMESSLIRVATLFPAPTEVVASIANLRALARRALQFRFATPKRGKRKI
jgi:hypothetical protein